MHDFILSGPDFIRYLTYGIFFFLTDSGTTHMLKVVHLAGGTGVVTV